MLGAVSTDPISWIELDLLHKSQKVVWADMLRPVGFGSLLKPFLVLAFAATHWSFPTFVCRGVPDRCWLGRGHGEQSVVAALANSCNCYFLHLARLIDRAALDAVCLRYGLALPAREVSEEALIGLGGGWQNLPLSVVRAFAQLTDQTVLKGMAQCAVSGTAKSIHLPCYAKTGTAPCSHTPRGMGDGFVAVLYPMNQPRRVLLLEQHGTTGAEACHAVGSRIDLR
jgi:hypothetical protein